MFENIVFSSGGIKGPGFVGAYKYLSENNLHKNIKNLLGCSAGSLMALSISLGYSDKELEGITIGLNTEKFVNKENNIFDIVDNFGFDEGAYLIKIVKVLIKKKSNNEDLTFKEHYKMFKKKLIVVACNVNLNKDEFFNYKTYPNMKIWEAIRMSCSIPIVFTPYKFNNYLYVDGGLNNACPSNYFKDQNKTLIFILESSSCQNYESKDFKGYLSNLLFYNIRCNKNKNKKRKNCITIVFDKDNIDDGFDISVETKKELMEIGYNTTKELLPIIIENIQTKKKKIN